MNDALAKSQSDGEDRKPTKAELDAIWNEMYRVAQRVRSKEAKHHTTRGPTDLVNTTLIKIMSGKNSSRTIDDLSLAEWRYYLDRIATIMRRKLIDKGRARKHRPTPESHMLKGDGAEQTLDWYSLQARINNLPDNNESMVFLDPEELVVVADAINLLQEEHPEASLVFNLRLEGSKIDEVALALGISPSTVKRQYRVAVDSMRQNYQ